MPDSPPEPLYTFRGKMKPVHCLFPVISESDELLYVGTNYGTVHVWDLKTKREKRIHEVGSEACLCIIYNCGLFLTQLKGDSIKFWIENITGEWQLHKILKHDYYGFCKVGLLRNRIYLPKSGSDIAIYDSKSNHEKILEGEKDLGEIMCMTTIISIESVLVCYESGHMILWDKEWSASSKIKLTEDCPMVLDFCEHTMEGILGSNSNKLIKFALNCKNNNITLMKEVLLTNSGVSSISINEEGKLFVVGCWDNRIRYYTMKKLTLLAVLTYHNDSVDSIIFINKELSFCDKGLVVAGGKDCRISLWNLYTNLRMK